MKIEIDGPNVVVNGKKYVPAKSPTSSSETMAEMLTRLRAESGLTMQQVADSVRCSKSYIFQLEKGESSPGLNIAIYLASTYSVPLSEFAVCRRNK